METIFCSCDSLSADNPDPELVVPSSALLDPWSDSYSGESRKVTEERGEESGQNHIQRRHGVWDLSAEPEAETEGGGWGRAEGERVSEGRRPNNRHRRRRRRRRLKRSPVHHQYGGRGVHRGAHPEHYATRYSELSSAKSCVGALEDTPRYSSAKLGLGM